MTSSASVAAICAHQRTLALVAVAAAAEHDMQLVCGVRAQRLQHLFQRIRRVGVIDIDRRAVGGEGDLLHPARRAFQMLQRGEHLAGILAQTDGQAGRDQAHWTPGRRRPAAASTL